MAYRIDFTESNYINRSRRKTALRLLLLALLAGVAYGVHSVYTTYNEPTLNMKLAAYEAVARPIEDVNAAWDEAAREYGRISCYYRLLWASNPTNFLDGMAAADAPGLGRGFHPRKWTLKTGGECRLDYAYSFQPGDKAAQARQIEAALASMVTSLVMVASNKVDVQGVRLENLLDESHLDIMVGFSLPDARKLTARDPALIGCVNEIAAMRRKVQNAKIVKSDDPLKASQSTAGGIMMAYLPPNYRMRNGKALPGFPESTNVINVAGWFERADQFAKEHKIPDDMKNPRRGLLDDWNKVGNARYPWDRFRALDNDELVAGSKALASVAEGVRRFREFLERRRIDCRKKLEPFVNAYEGSDVFNQPLVKTDLEDRVAKKAGIDYATVKFEYEPGESPSDLVMNDETYSFSWVRWRLTVGDGVKDGLGSQTAASSEGRESALTLRKVADCARRALELGPGYALDSVVVTFDAESGRVVEAVFEGLLPVKKTVKADKKGGE